MTACSDQKKVLNELLHLLELEKIEENIFRGKSQDLGFGPVTAVDPTKAGAADVSFTARHVDMVIDGLGFGGVNDHTINETGDLTTLPLQTKRAAVFIYRLSKQNL